MATITGTSLGEYLEGTAAADFIETGDAGRRFGRRLQEGRSQSFHVASRTHGNPAETGNGLGGRSGGENRGNSAKQAVLDQ